MKLVSFVDGHVNEFPTVDDEERCKDQSRVGIVLNDGSILDLEAAIRCFDITWCYGTQPLSMQKFLDGLPQSFELAKGVVALHESSSSVELANEKAGDYLKSADSVTLLSPVPRPRSFRDGFAFRGHVESSCRQRGVDVKPEYDQFPVFYFSNHNSFKGDGVVRVEKDHCLRLDFELECAVVIGKMGRNISCQDADKYIFGLSILNDFSARTLQVRSLGLIVKRSSFPPFSLSLSLSLFFLGCVWHTL